MLPTQFQHFKLILPALFLGAGLIFGYGKGAKPGSTNAPGETTCQAENCHTQNPVNLGPGKIRLSGVPQFFEPGTTYNLTVELAQQGQKRWGFQITALDQHNRPAGSLIVIDSLRTRFKWGEELSPNPRQYIEHSLEGSYMGVLDGPVAWHLDWKAPVAGSDTVFFYTVGNAANFNKKPWGDFIYTRFDTTFNKSRNGR